MKSLRFLAVSLVLASLAVAVNAQSTDAAKKSSAKPVTLKIEFVDGRESELKCLTTMLRLEAEFGAIDLLLDKVKTLDFKQDGDRLDAVVELVDKSHLTGSLLTSELRLDNGGSLALKDVREIKVIRPKDHSILALAFGLVTLTVMEIVLGIDNIIFLAIVASRLPQEKQRRARRIGLVAALVTRLGLLFTLSFILGLTKPIFTLPIPGLSADAAELSWRDMILLFGGGFLIVKSVRELHHKVGEAQGENPKKIRKAASFLKTILLIAVIDIVFSLDSVITAVGMVDVLEVMIAAMVLAMGVMLLFAEPVSRFVEKYPTVKVLALSFLILIGVLLMAEGMGQHIEKGYVYFAMAFAVVIEFINMSLRPKLIAEAVAEG